MWSWWLFSTMHNWEKATMSRSIMSRHDMFQWKPSFRYRYLDSTCKWNTCDWGDSFVSAQLRKSRRDCYIQQVDHVMTCFHLHNDMQVTLGHGGMRERQRVAYPARPIRMYLALLCMHPVRCIECMCTEGRLMVAYCLNNVLLLRRLMLSSLSFLFFCPQWR